MTVTERTKTAPFAPGGPSAHVDTFTRDNLPPENLRAPVDYSALPALAAYPDRINAASALLSARLAAGDGDRVAVYFHDRQWTYAEFDALTDRMAKVLTEDMGLVTGNRVLLRGPNNLMNAAAWFAVLKAGGICVATMPLLRARELSFIVEKAQIRHALCDVDLGHEMQETVRLAPDLAHVAYFSGDGQGGADFDRAVAGKDPGFDIVDTAADDVAVIAFTSGTTGQPKGCMHFHRDIMAMCDCFPPHVFRADAGDIITGSPPLAFAFGLGALLCFPFHVGAATALIDKVTPDAMLENVQRHKCTALYTAPTAYRALLGVADKYDISSLQKCVSAGETLPLPTWQAWHEATGLEIIDGIGTTEMLHIFVSSPRGEIRPGATGRVVPGYEARVVGDDGKPVADGEIGKMAVRGPTGCKYLDNIERQSAYVQNGWNLTGDLYRRDEDGYFWYVSRADDLIISAGYNISGPEVETALLEHPAVVECGVVGQPDPERGQIVSAHIVLEEGASADDAMVKTLQDFVKQSIAPYKYPRAITFVDSLPRTETGKLQRFKLRDA